MSEPPPYAPIVRHYEACLARHGDSHRGVDWPNARDAETRYRVMLDVIREPAGTPVSLLDFGCGAGHLLEYIRGQGLSYVDYRGLDVSAPFIALCRAKFPQVAFHEIDVLTGTDGLPTCDYIVLNGVFTEKRELAWDVMFDYMGRVLAALWPFARRGMAFNVMSKEVEWERDDLFHVPCDAITALLTARFGRHFVLRNDYGLYDYTVYLYRGPTA